MVASDWLTQFKVTLLFNWLTELLFKVTLLFHWLTEFLFKVTLLFDWLAKFKMVACDWLTQFCGHFCHLAVCHLPTPTASQFIFLPSPHNSFFSPALTSPHNSFFSPALTLDKMNTAATKKTTAAKKKTRYSTASILPIGYHKAWRMTAFAGDNKSRPCPFNPYRTYLGLCADESCPHNLLTAPVQEFIPPPFEPIDMRQFDWREPLAHKTDAFYSDCSNEFQRRQKDDLYKSSALREYAMAEDSDSDHSVIDLSMED